jgi:hypothetical protein
MFDILKWFFGIVAVIIFAYVTVVSIRSLLSNTIGVVSDVSQSTSSAIVTSSTNSLRDWFSKLYSPAPFVPGAIVVGDGNSNNQGYRNPIADKILNAYSETDFYGNKEDTFDERWGGRYSRGAFFDEPSVDNQTTPLANKLPEMIFPSAVLNNLQFHGKCVVGGCNMEFCVDQKEITQLVSTCEYRPAYSCYRNAICERDSRSGKCGWRVDNQLASCLQNN